MAQKPKLGELIDKMFELREKKRKFEASAAELSKQITALEDEVLEKFSKSELEGASGKKAKVSVKVQRVPTVKDWPKFWLWVFKTKASDMLQHRVNGAAWRERLEAGKQVPGVEPFDRVSLSLTRRK